MLAALALAASLAFAVLPNADVAGLAADADVAVTARLRYAVPDLATGRRLIPDLNTPLGGPRFGLDVIAGWTGCAQGGNSIAQVGAHYDRFEVRSARLQVSGAVSNSSRLAYRLAAQYKDSMVIRSVAGT